jgi:hypothetical protein
VLRVIVRAGHSTYPLVTFSYALVYRNMGEMHDRGAAVANFLKYINMVRTRNTPHAPHTHTSHTHTLHTRTCELSADSS